MRILPLALLLPGLAIAGRPLSTEDAATLADNACQLEGWADRTRGNVTDFFLVPACAHSGIEVQAGAVRTTEGGHAATSATFVQAKHAFRNVADGAWGIGLVVRLQRELRRETKNDWGDPYLVVPVSFGIGEDKDTRWLVHLNVGTARARDESRNLTLWGVATEKPVGGGLTLVAETFGANAARPFVRAGGRYAILPALYVDLTYVIRAGAAREESLWSVGFHGETGPFLP